MKASLFVIILFAQSFAAAQSLTQNVRGKVLDTESERPLFGATVIVLNSDPLIGSSTDFDGNYRLINVPIGRHSLKISMLGYEDQIIPNVQLGTGKEIILNIRLRESLFEMKTVEISDEKTNKAEAMNEMAAVSARAFSVEETKRYAGALNDPGRMALSFAGVSANNDLSNEIVVRGNSPRGLLWRMEGIEIPNPNHFSNVGSSGGAISMLNVNMMANSDFFTGAFPAEFGNATGGVFDMRLRKGNNEKRESAFQIGVIGTDIALEGPIKKDYQGSYLINYRYSSLGLLQKAGLDIVGDAVPTFQDLAYNIFLPSKRYGNFSLFGILGQSAIDQTYLSKEFQRKSNFKTTLGVLGLTHAYTFGDKALLKTVVAYTETKNRYLEKEFDLSEHYKRDIFDENFLNEAVRINTYFNYKVNAANSIRVGAIYSILGYDLFTSFFNDEQGSMEQLLKSDGNTATAQSFINWRSRLNEKITLNAGLHYTYFMLNKNQSLEPRAGIKWALDTKQNISAGIGMHSRIEDLSFYMFQRQSPTGMPEQLNRNVGFSKAMHYVLGYDRMLNEQLNFKVETYYQQLYNIPTDSEGKNYISAINMTDGFFNIKADNQGTGRNYGIDFTLERFFHKQFFFLVTGSLFDSKYKGSDGVLRNTTFNGQYGGNFLFGKEFALGADKKNNISVSVRFVGAGGRFFSPILLEESISAGRAVYDEVNAFSEKSMDYFRTDFQISYTINKKNRASIWKIDIQNVSNRANMYARFYNDDFKAIQTFYQGGIIPTLSYRIEF